MLFAYQVRLPWLQPCSSGIDHDWVVNFSSGLGALAAAGTIIGLYQIKWRWLFVLGLFNIILVGLNNYAYYGNDPIVYLPVVQKISFASFLTWIFMIAICMYKKQGKVFKSG